MSEIALDGLKPRLWVRTIWNYWRQVEGIESILFFICFIPLLVFFRILIFPFYEDKYK